MDDLAGRCTGCGNHLDESTALDDRGRPLHDYDVRSTVCYACEAATLEQRRITQDGGDDAMAGRLFFTHRDEEPTRG